jgi:hypothetical protein
VRLPDGHVHSCELRDHSRLGAAWELQILVDGELLFGRPCVDEHQARRVAEMAKGDCGGKGASDKLAGRFSGWTPVVTAPTADGVH